MIVVVDVVGHMLQKATNGVGCTIELINDLFCVSTTAQINVIHELYNKCESTKLCDRLKAELVRSHKDLILKLLLHGRGSNARDDGLAEVKAAEIYQILAEGQEAVSDAESKLIAIFVENSASQLKAIAVRLFPL